MSQLLILVGNLGRDPEMRYTASGTPVANFSMAVNESYKDAEGEKHEWTVWFRITAWGKLGEIANQYLSKGRQVKVEGVLSPDKETGGPKVFERRDGSSGAAYEVRARDIEFLGNRSDNDGSGAFGGEEPSETEEEDEIPF